ncbi:PAS domain S-box protein [Rhodopila sp.]|uniref:PAS domain S-box protein n=1 Tax=Rhodopila sp. TaxID=2480087 RepID=UPI003D0D32AF
MQVVQPEAVAPPLARERLSGISNLSLRSRLLLLVIVSVIPLACLVLGREYSQYQSERDGTYQGLVTIAHGVALSVERDLLLRSSALETLAMSPTLQSDNVAQFDQEAETFLAHQPDGTVLGLGTPDAKTIRIYGLPRLMTSKTTMHTASAAGRRVFDTGRPLVTDLHVGHVTGQLGFSIDVPVFKQGRVVYDLFITLRPSAVADLVSRQRLPPGTILSVADSAGLVVARLPNPERYIGHPIVPALWAEVKAHIDGIGQVPTLEGTPSLAAFAHVTPFNWSIIVGAPEQVLAAPLRAAIIRTVEDAGFVLIAGLILARLAARRITGPIEQLRRLAERGDAADAAHGVSTGLPETDTVARALVSAAAERQATAVALAESEQRFRDLFEQSPSGIILADPETTQVVDCNEAAASFVGYPVEEFRQVKLIDLSLQTTHERILDVGRAVAGGEVSRYETWVQGRQGPRDLLIAVAPVRVDGRTLMLISQLDVTELRAAEAGLRLNEERLELARQGASLGIWDWDIANKSLSWSDHQWHLHGLDPLPDGPTPEVWRQVIHPADTDRVGRELRRALKQPSYPFATEFTVVLKDGAHRRLLARGQTIRNTQGRAVRLVGINMDVTARYEAEVTRDRLIDLLKAEQRRLSEIIDVLPVGVGIVDRDGLLVLSNPTVQRFADLVVPSVNDPRPDDWIAYHSDGRRFTRDEFPVSRALCGEAVSPGVECLLRADNGAERWFRVASIPLRWADGQVQEVLSVLQDIDAERRLVDIQQQANIRLELRVREEVAAREAAQQRAAQAERVQALGQIAGGIAHDFNNVLQAVSGGAALIERRPDNPERVSRHARMIADAARRGAAITSRLLAFARRGDLRAESLDAGALLADMLEVLSHTLGGSVVCELDVPEGLPPLFADRGQLETVLVNLATNARDAMPSGGVLTMSASVEADTTNTRHPAGLAPGAYMRISVSDTGTGMDAAVLARVTEPFFTTKEPGKGTGLGLAMAKGFVEQSGGRMSIQSTIGRGTCISLWLPQANDAAAGSRETLASPGASPQLPCVLLVDDDAIVREVLTASLEDAGYLVLAADSGSAALSLLRAEERVRIIVSDLTMPVMDGVSLIRSAQALRPGLPAVLLTGYAGDGATLAFGGAISGAFSLLRKPVSGIQLVDRISGLLESRKLRNRH